MRMAIVLGMLLIAQVALASGIDQFSGRTLRCGKVTLKFGQGSETASINGGAPQRVQWGNGGIDAEIRGMYLEYSEGPWLLDGKKCRLLG